MRAAQRLAIKGNHLSVSQGSNRLHSEDEALLDLITVQAAKISPKVSCDGIPFGNSKKMRSQSSFALPNSYISVKCSARQVIAKMAIAIISIGCGVCSHYPGADREAVKNNLERVNNFKR
jgi:hypothetical protein